MTNYHFWRGNLVRLRAIEQKDLDADAQDFSEYDTDAENYNRELRFRYTASKLSDIGKLHQR